MLNVVYLVLVFGGGHKVTASVSIPQANMKQCEVNANYYYKNDPDVVRTHCIVGVMPK